MSKMGVLDYMVHTIGEETIFRALGFIVFGSTLSGLLATTLVYALSHYHMFDERMVRACIPVGFALGVIYLMSFGSIFTSNPYAIVVLNIIICSGVHLLLAWFGWSKGWVQKWARPGMEV